MEKITISKTTYRLWPSHLEKNVNNEKKNAAKEYRVAKS